MTCPYCGVRVKWWRTYYSILEHRDIKVFCLNCDKVITITQEDAERERELRKLGRRERDRAEGLCNRCGYRRPEKGNITCDSCLAKARKIAEEKAKAPKMGKQYGINQKEWAYRRYYGLCVVCGEPAEKSATLCKKCKEQMRNNKTSP